jgi:hypothetical protein
MSDVSPFEMAIRGLEKSIATPAYARDLRRIESKEQNVAQVIHEGRTPYTHELELDWDSVTDG